MKKIILLIALLFSLLALSGCSQSACEAPDHSQTSDVASSNQASAVASSNGEEYQAIKRILEEQIRLYECGCYGTEYTGDKKNGYLSGFAGMYCQTNHIEYGAESDRQSLIRLGTKEYFDITFNEDHYFSNVSYDDKRLRVLPTETIINDDIATVVVQRFLNGEELLDNKYTFQKAVMPQSFEGTIFKQLAYDNCIWKIVKVEAIKNPIPSQVVEISNAHELIKFSNDVGAKKAEAVNGNFVLTADIDLTDNSELMPIGTFNEDAIYDTAALNLSVPMGFNGTFDGAGYTISGFKLNEQTKALGFFRVLNDDAVVKNLKLQGSVVNSYTEDGNCHTGGFAGIISTNASVENCSFTGDVDGYSYVGGFVGSIKYTNNNASVDEEGFRVAGDGLLKNCTSSSKVTAAYHAGGFAGSILGDLDHCTASGEVVIAKKYGGIPMAVGGFCGDLSTPLNNCHSDVKVIHYVNGANRMGNFIGELGRANVANCTIKADVVNPDWFMVGMKDYSNADVDIKIVD